MNVLGIRCSNRDFAYTILNGSKSSPIIVHSDIVAYPKGYSKSQSLKWFLLEIEDLLKKHDIKRIVMKQHEGPTRSKAYEERVEHEAMVYLADEDLGIGAVFKKRGCTIAKDLGLKGRAHYLITSLDTSSIPDYDNLPEKIKDAVLVAWSELPT